MSKGHSPSRFSRGMDDAMLYDATFAQDISHKMRVPKRIKATGDVGDEDMAIGAGMPWEYQDKFDMNVPDRILLVGQDQHIGAKAPPREMTLENSVLPSDPGMIRVNTPPRVITLDHHFFPTAAENTHSNPTSVEESGICVSPPNRNNTRDVARYTLNQNDNRRHLRESTPLSSEGMNNTTLTGAGEGLSAAEEMVHLRRQMARLNRRLMAVEMEGVRRQQRERLLAAAGLAYLVLKVLAWLNRN